MSKDNQPQEPKKLKEEKPIAMSREFLASRGVCCGNYCVNCCYYPRHTAGTNQKYFIS